jgi:hypothetical protein
MTKHFHNDQNSQEKYQEILNTIIPNFANEIVAFQTTFGKQMDQGINIKPMLVAFDANNRKHIVSFIRDYDESNQDDFYAAVSELLFIIPALRAKAFILVIDRNSNKYFDTEKVYPFSYSNSVVAFVVNDEIAIATEIEYNYVNNKVQWTDNLTYFQIVDIKDIFVEMMFVYSHVDEPPFSYPEMLEFLSKNGVYPMIVDELSDANEVYMMKKGVYTT